MAWDLWRASENDRTISDSRRRCRASLPIRSPLQRGSACRRCCGPMDPGEVDPAQPWPCRLRARIAVGEFRLGLSIIVSTSPKLLLSPNHRNLSRCRRAALKPPIYLKNEFQTSEVSVVASPRNATASWEAAFTHSAGPPRRGLAECVSGLADLGCRK